MKKYSFYIKNLDCPNCARKIENELNKKDCYENVSINFSKLTLSLESDLDDVLLSLQKDVESIEKGVVITLNVEGDDSLKWDFACLGLGALSFLFSLLFQNITMLSILFCIISYIFLGYQIFLKAISLVKKGILDENFLLVVSAIGAFGISKSSEGFMVLFLYKIGKFLEKKATNRVRKNVADLMSLKPSFANKVTDSGYTKVRPESVKVDDILLVKKGEKVPLDGILLDCDASLDTSSLTGESKVSVLKKGEEVLSGSVNLGDVFQMRVISVYEDSTVKRILDLLEHASDRKAKTENFVNKAARYYTPIMLGVSFLIFLITPFLFSISFSNSLYRALMILVVSCPCAIAISVPLCYFAGLGKMSKEGILVKGSNYIDAIHQMNFLIFDKTGTLTTGSFGVLEIQIFDSSYTEDDVIKYLVYGESYSNHPLAQSILRQYSSISVPKISNFKEIEGSGVLYSYKKDQIKLGSAKFVSFKKNLAGTTIFVSVNDQVIACAILGDEIKDNANFCVEELKKSGIETMMFTGDDESIAKETSKKLNLNGYRAKLLPDEKYHAFMNLKEEHSNQILCFVGDGINDAPVLRVSDCGIAMGSGSASAIEASDVVIMSSDLSKILIARNVASRTIHILKENLIFALSIKLIVIFFSFFGIGTMWIAVFADVGVTLLTILNSLRILR